LPAVPEALEPGKAPASSTTRSRQTGLRAPHLTLSWPARGLGDADCLDEFLTIATKYRFTGLETYLVFAWGFFYLYVLK